MNTKTHGTLEYSCAEAISVPHAFTTRLGGVSRGFLGSMNLALHRGDASENVAKNYEILGQALGFDPKNLVFSHQVHGDTVRAVGPEDAMGPDHHRYPECDGLITNTPGVALAVFTADCTPVLLYDPVTGAVGAVHAGWRGTALGIAGKAVQAMCAHYGCVPENIRAAIGPNIGQCCFETDRDVADAMRKSYGPAAEPYLRPENEKFYVDLKGLNALCLSRAGVESVDISGDCIRCQPERYFSHRLQGARRGSQGAIIVRR